MTPRSAETSATAIKAWIELDARSSDGFDIRLLWSGSEDRLKVTVADRRLDATFEIDVAGADARTAYHHPFAYASEGDRRYPAATSRAATPPSQIRTGAHHVNH